MPSPQTNVRRLDRKIRELEEKDQLSDANVLHLDFMRRWRDFAGRDVVLVVEPKGVVTRGEPPKAKIVEATDMHAAELLTYGAARGQRVRIATDEEIRAYRTFNLRQAEAHRASIAAKAAEHARASVMALLGIQTGQPFAPGDPAAAPTPVAETPPPAAVFGEGHDAPIVAELPGNPDAPEQADASRSSDGPEATAPSAPAVVLSEIADEALVAALAEAGVGTVQAVAESDPETLSKSVRGLKKAQAAALIATAAEALAQAAKGAVGPLPDVSV